MSKRTTAFFLISLLFSQNLELPKILKTDQVIHHSYFTLAYSEHHEQSKWVAYTILSSEVYGSITRTNNFRIDPNVQTGSASLLDYKGSGYDRGHLVPAGDMKRSRVAMSESFFMSNISPQISGFNRGIWKKLEEIVRNWAVDNEKIYIATGPVLTKSYPTIGNNKVSIPDYYYKVILDYKKPEFKAIGFILPNKKSKQSIESYVVTVDSVEKFTDIDFFHNLPDKIERIIESDLDISKWNFN